MRLFILAILTNSNFNKAAIKYSNVLISINGEIIIEYKDIIKPLAIVRKIHQY